ncbi:acetate--CoA ligase family protein [Candidatus Bipolaricaulota bacterium]|nr:acetate--CoA ligase family protein [Candidatus Bipolaricaulota bacterium]
MARILEDHGKGLLAECKIPIPTGKAAATAAAAAQSAQEIGFPVAIKALVPVGKRGKAGAIAFADNEKEALDRAEKILGMTVSGYPVEQVLVEQKLAIAREIYLSITIDKAAQRVAIVASSLGGVNIEQLSREHPDKVSKTHIDPLVGLPGYKAIEIWSDLGLTGKLLRQASTILIRLYRMFVRYDATLAEINPLVLTEEETIVAADCVLNIDENALYRQPALADSVQPGSDRAWRPLTELEKSLIEASAKEAYRGTARYTEFDGGDIGFMCGGGGASLLLMDALSRAGGRPANYSEIGGNPPESKVYSLCKGILSKPGVKGLFLAHNITNNTQIDLMAKGVVAALDEMGIDPKVFPVVVREAGTHDEEGRQIFIAAGIEYHGDDITLDEAALLMVEKMRRAYPDYDQWEGAE